MASLDPKPTLWSNEQMNLGRVLALDYGARNVGLAYCDEIGVTISPLPSIPNHGSSDLIGRLRSAIGQNQISHIVVGIPWNMNGSAGVAVDRVEHFILSLQQAVPVPISRSDERLSTIEARELWNRLSSKRRQRYRTIDSLAAAQILQRFLTDDAGTD